MRAPTAAGAVAGLGAAVALGLPVVLALTSAHLAGAPALVVTSTVAGALATGAFAVVPWLAARGRASGAPGRRRRGLRAHAALGITLAVLVAVHVGALVALEPDDAAFAMSPAGPTRARMALLSTVLLATVVALGLLRRRLHWSGPTWRLLHGGLATLAIVLGVGHAVLTDGALEGAGTSVLVGLALVALLGVAAAAAGRRAARRLPGALRRSAAEPDPAAAAARAAGTARGAGPPPPGPPSPTPSRR